MASRASVTRGPTDLKSKTGEIAKSSVQYFKGGVTFGHKKKMNIIGIHRKHTKCKSLSRVQLFVNQWTVARQAPLSMRFSRQDYWSGLPFPSPGDLPEPDSEPVSPALQADSLPSVIREALTHTIDY